MEENVSWLYLLVYQKQDDTKKKDEVMMLLHCLNALPSPPTPNNPSLLSTPHLAPPPTPYLPRLQPTPFTHVLSGSMPLHAMLNHQGCVHLCVLIICDRWGCFVFSAQSHFLPVTISLYHQRGMVGWVGGGFVKDGQSGAVCPDMTNPEGDASLSLGCCVKWQTGRCSVTSVCQCLD